MLGLRTLFKRLGAKLRKQPVQLNTPPRTIEAWEDFDKASMRDLLDDITEQAQHDFDELSDSLHNPN
jgi:hypothetical protein